MGLFARGPSWSSARVENPANDALWLSAVRLEARHGTGLEDTCLSKALTECPASGKLWAEKIRLAKRSVRRGVCVAALKVCDSDANVVAAAGMMFWEQLKYDKARKWFAKATALDPDNGDVWGAYLAFEMAVGTPEQASAVVAGAVKACPTHGEVFQSISKTNFSSSSSGFNLRWQAFSGKCSASSGQRYFPRLHFSSLAGIITSGADGS